MDAGGAGDSPFAGDAAQQRGDGGEVNGPSLDLGAALRTHSSVLGGDGEGRERAWVASEGRRIPERPPQLLRFDRHSGELELAMPMPAEWQPAPGQGLDSNRGPESLTLLLRQGKPAVLLMAAESALLQDPPGQVRVLGWTLGSSMESPAGDPKPQQPLRLPQGDGWGLTDLLAQPETSNEAPLLGLQRRFQSPDQWSNRLVLYPFPKPITSGANPAVLSPLMSWDLKAIGLSPDNWEAITPGPPLEDGRPTLLLAADDNFSPLQDNHLVQLAPRRILPLRVAVNLLIQLPQESVMVVAAVWGLSMAE